ncbi:hypothetical protein LG649_14830 [Tamlana sp. PT2-4]|uniref:Uncharacterized protein n=1 Tax=Neotamlana laminarinivorans TaxID=2883124 RepID=A0A9X1I523_9FLAO|nr:hypothetical protein [Tamlana laminarinivorans]MCB4800124.1 hypothetical protein [Tamlana laminarinivorans]
MKLERACIYPKDIQRITGRTERYGRKLLSKIKQHFNKEPHQFITIKEFSEYTGIDQDTIQEYVTS